MGRFAGFKTSVPGLETINKIEPRSFDVLHAHGAHQITWRYFLHDLGDDFFARGFRVGDDDEFTRKPAVEHLSVLHVNGVRNRLRRVFDRFAQLLVFRVGSIEPRLLADDCLKVVAGETRRSQQFFQIDCWRDRVHVDRRRGLSIGDHLLGHAGDHVFQLQRDLFLGDRLAEVACGTFQHR